MSNLYKPNKYPPELRQALGQMSDTAIEIANRWMLGWPQTVKDLIATGEYLDALKAQEREEIRVKLEPGLNHLSSWEKAEVYGLSQHPPAPSELLDEKESAEEEETEAELHLKKIHKLYTEMGQEISQAFIALVEKNTDEKGGS